jgi:hypothetical protein
MKGCLVNFSNKMTSPLEKGDFPDIDASELLDAKGSKTYQSMIIALQ